MKGCRFQDATFESALDATSRALHAARLKDLVRSLNAKSALTIGDSCPPMFPEAAIHACYSLGFDINIFKCQVGVDDWGLVSLTFSKRQSTRQLFIGL